MLFLLILILNTCFFTNKINFGGSKSLKIFKISLTFRFNLLKRNVKLILNILSHLPQPAVIFIKIRSHRRKFSNSDSVEQNKLCISYFTTFFNFDQFSHSSFSSIICLKKLQTFHKAIFSSPCKIYFVFYRL
jgi:hypothetical protein